MLPVSKTARFKRRRSPNIRVHFMMRHGVNLGYGRRHLRSCSVAGNILKKQHWTAWGRAVAKSTLRSTNQHITKHYARFTWMDTLKRSKQRKMDIIFHVDCMQHIQVVH
jgi:hypothetical protein